MFAIFPCSWLLCECVHKCKRVRGGGRGTEYLTCLVFRSCVQCIVKMCKYYLVSNLCVLNTGNISFECIAYPYNHHYFSLYFWHFSCANWANKTHKDKIGFDIFTLDNTPPHPPHTLSISISSLHLLWTDTIVKGNLLYCWSIPHSADI